MYKRAFTLAEVLITLGIIGVVAAITMPTLIQNHKKIEVETKLKRVYSLVNQALKMSEAEYGDMTNWDLDCGCSQNPTCTIDETVEKFNYYIGKNLKTNEIKKGEKGFYVYLTDGSILFVWRYLYDIGYYISEKAVKNPKSGRNYFEFRFMPKVYNSQNQGVNDNTYNIKPYFEPYATLWDGTEEQLLNKNRGNGCGGESNNSYCTKLIQYNGWKVPNNYPYKF